MSEVTILVIYAVLAIGVSFFCSIAEAVLLSITPSFIAIQKQKNPTKGQQIASLKANIDRPLVSILSLNTIAHTVGATGVGAQASKVFGSEAIGIVSAVMTFLILFLSEIIPKTIGAVYWKKLASVTSTCLVILSKAFYPFIVVSELITRAIGKASHHKVTREELGVLADLSRDSGQIGHSESRILKSLLSMPNTTVGDIMTPRTVLISFDKTLTIKEAMSQKPNLPVSRIPIFKENIDQIIGFVLRDDMLVQAAKGEDQKPLEALKRPILTMPSSSNLLRVFEELLKVKQQIALIVDEYGGTHGVVTLEDIVETILGIEIVDEADQQADMRELARKKWRARMKKIGEDLSSEA